MAVSYLYPMPARLRGIPQGCESPRRNRLFYLALRLVAGPSAQHLVNQIILKDLL